jgi:hypothetical protein
MALREAAPVARKMFDYHSRTDYLSLTSGQNISLGQRIGKLARAIFGERVRYQVWHIERIKKYAEEVRNYVSDLRSKNQPSVELGRLELFLTDLFEAL